LAAWYTSEVTTSSSPQMAVVHSDEPLQEQPSERQLGATPPSVVLPGSSASPASLDATGTATHRPVEGAQTRPAGQL
jgi:hypothetical protein